MNNEHANIVLKNDQCTISTVGNTIMWTDHETDHTAPANSKDAIDVIWCTMIGDMEPPYHLTRECALDLFRRVLNRLHGEVTIGTIKAPGGDLYQQADPVGFAVDMMRCLMITGHQLAEHADSNPDITQLPLARLGRA